MSETISHAPVPEPTLAANQFELSAPRNQQGERIGTGAIIESGRPGASSETLGSAFMKALSRTTRPMQRPRGVAEQAAKRTGHSFVTEQERATAAARTQEEQIPVPAQSQADVETTKLAQADREQTQEKLTAARSALNSEVAAQTSPAKQPQSQERSEGAGQPADKKEKKTQQETELIHFYNRQDGYEQFALHLPRNFTAEDVNKTLKRAGLNYSYSPEKWISKSDKQVTEERRAQGKDPETETIVLRSEKDGHVVVTFEAPKNATRAELNRAAQAAGWRMSPGRTAFNRLATRGNDLWAALKIFFQSAAPQEAQQPGQKAAWLVKPHAC